jgi:hypothetical protein
MVVAGASCTTVPPQSPAGPAQHQNPNTSGAPAPPTVTGSQRLQHAWNKAMEGLAMGGTIGGPYGAGGGLVIGLIAGLFMADSHYTALNTQIQSEHQKDRQLEAALEQELARQRELETQIASAAAADAGTSGDQPNAQSQAVTTQPALSREASSSNRPSETLAAVNKSTVTQAPPPLFKNAEVRDINGDGVPDLWLYFNPQKPGEIIRQEEASRNDGRVNTWSYFKDGLLVRREVDSRGHGRADTVFYYVNDKIAREERDETGQGRMTYRATFEGGRVAKVEKETGGNGRTDLWLHYDTARDGEVVIKEEKDLNGDGLVDLWSYYDNGRLARRDVSAVGLEILFKEDKPPLSTAELRQVSPGS